MTDYISRKEALETMLSFRIGWGYAKVKGVINSIPAADVRPAEDYNKLLKAAKAMHTWIFLHTGGEQAVYDECNLDDEMNALLGYGGSFEIHMREEQT